MPEFNPTIHGTLRQPNNRGKALLKSYAGRRFNRLLVLGFLGMSQGRQAQWLCRCDCGKFWVTTPTRLLNGESQSCGCWNYDKPPASKTHGKAKSFVHRIWCGIRTRINNPKHHSHPRYGGRGLTLCSGMQTFAGFYAVVGEPPKGKDSIDRWPDNANGGYWCGSCDECSKNGWSKNVRWADAKEQSANTKKNVYLTANGETLIMAEWERKLGIDHQTIRSRLSKGWTDAQALGVDLPPKP